MKLLRLTQPRKCFVPRKDGQPGLDTVWDVVPVYINPAMIVGIKPIDVQVDEKAVGNGRIEAIRRPGSSIITPGGMGEEMRGFTVTETPDEIIRELAKL